MLVTLYLIEILHQTTTIVINQFYIVRCILLKFYIKPQQDFTIFVFTKGCILLKFYIKPQHDAEPRGRGRRCILLKFYIKPQQ